MGEHISGTILPMDCAGILYKLACFSCMCSIIMSTRRHVNHLLTYLLLETVKLVPIFFLEKLLAACLCLDSHSNPTSSSNVDTSIRTKFLYVEVSQFLHQLVKCSKRLPISYLVPNPHHSVPGFSFSTRWL